MKRLRCYRKYMFISLLVISVWFLYADDNLPENGSFRTTFMVTHNPVGEDSSAPVFTFNRENIDHNLVFFYQPLSRAYFYLLLESPSDKIYTLYPEDFSQFTKEYYANKLVFPPDTNWSNWIKDPGEYVINFIVTTSRLKVLEALIDQYSIALTSGSKKIDPIAVDLKGEIKRLKRNYLLSSNIENLPEVVTGTFRNTQEAPEQDYIRLYFQDSPESEMESPDPLLDQLEQHAISIDFNSLYILEIYIDYQ